MCVDQMLGQTWAAAITGGVYTHTHAQMWCEAAFALLMCTLSVLLLYLRTGDYEQFWGKQISEETASFNGAATQLIFTRVSRRAVVEKSLQASKEYVAVYKSKES